jgi:hypothetical protein
MSEKQQHALIGQPHRSLDEAEGLATHRLRSALVLVGGQR